MRRAALLLGLVGLMAALAGCDSGPPVWTPSVAGDAPAEGGSGPRRVEVQVSDSEGGITAAVILAWVEEDGDGSLTVHRLGLRARDGTVIGHVPDARDIHVMAGSPGFTEEWLIDAVPAGSDAAVVPARLYRLEQHATYDDAWSGVEAPVVVGATENRVAWHSREIPLDPDPTANRAMQERIVALSGKLTWTNTPTAFGDLGFLAASAGDATACYLEDDDRDLGPGTYEQGFWFPDSDKCNWLFPWPLERDRIPPPIHVGPASDEHLVAPLEGVVYTVELDATLAASFGWQEFEEELGDRDYRLVWEPAGPGEGAPDDGLEAPAPVGLLVGLLLLVLAAVMRRR